MADSLLPVRREVALADGRTFTVRPFRVFGDLDALQDLLPRLAPFFAELAEGRLIGALQAAADPCLRLTALACRVDPESLAELDGDDQIRLIATALEVNLDFFAQRLTPVMLRTVSLMTATPSGRPSAPPRAPDTAEPSPGERTTATGPQPQPA